MSNGADIAVSLPRPTAHYFVVQRGQSKATQLVVLYAHYLTIFDPMAAAVFFARCWIERRRCWSRPKRIAVSHIVREADAADLRARGVIALTGRAAW